MLAGIDVSSWQGVVDWKAVAGSNIRFAFARVSDGMRHVDRRFQDNWTGMQSAGIARGCYQYLRPKFSGSSQAQLVVSSLRNAGCLERQDLPPACDLETLDGMPTDRVVDCAVEWCRTIEDSLFRKPLLYIGPYFMCRLGKDAARLACFAHLWVADYRNQPAIPNWTFWQYSASGRVPGVSGNVDLDWFNGGLAEMDEFILATGGTDDT